MRKILIMTSLLALALSCTKSPASKILVLYYSQTSNTKAVPAEIDRFLKEGGFIEGEYEKYDDFPAAQPATEEEARDIPREPDQAEQGHLIKVYVLC